MNWRELLQNTTDETTNAIYATINHIVAYQPENYPPGEVNQGRARKLRAFCATRVLERPARQSNPSRRRPRTGDRGPSTFGSTAATAGFIRADRETARIRRPRHLARPPGFTPQRVLEKGSCPAANVDEPVSVSSA